MASSNTHQAAILPQKGGPLAVASRPTPQPEANEVLIEVKAVALNPVDYYQRDFGMPPVPIYPAVIGGDASGIVVAVGSSAAGIAPPVGTRVLAFASSFFKDGSPDHGAFQEYALAQTEAVVALPDDVSFEQGAICPLAVWTALTAWVVIDIPLSTRFSAQDKQAVLIWGASSSVGSFAVQSARDLGFTVYATAGEKHHDYVKSLGAHAVFDYKKEDVVRQIVSKVKADGVKLTTAHCVVEGALQPTLDVLKETKGDAHAKVTHSPVLPEGHPTLDDTTITFNMPAFDNEARAKHLVELYGWLANGLKSGSVVPSPHIQTEAGGLEGLNAALDKLKAGVSGTKIVVPL